MDVSDVYTVFTAEIEARRSPTINIPDQELSIGELEAGEKYRIAILPATVEEQQPQEPIRNGEQPPVEEGETLIVEIEDIGENGDGIARIGPGFIVFVPGTRIGDRPEIEITDVKEKFAFGEVVEPESFTS